MRLQAFAVRGGIPFVEPLALLGPALDRSQACLLLNNLPAHLPAAPGVRLAAPAWTLLRSLACGERVRAALDAAGILTPCLLKPVAACGVLGAHAMALMLDTASTADAAVPLPCIAQAFVTHNPPTVHKVYVFGDTVLVQSRSSLPPPPASGRGSLSFDSLRCMPASWPEAGDGGCSGRVDAAAPPDVSPPLSMAAVHALADWLRARTGLCLFGFDVLVGAPDGEHAVVDLNAFPTAAGCEGAPAALAAALRARAAQGQAAC